MVVLEELEKLRCVLQLVLVEDVIEDLRCHVFRRGHGELLKVVESEGTSVVDELDFFDEADIPRSGDDLVRLVGMCQPDEDILRLQIRMNDAVFRQKLQRFRHLDNDFPQFVLTGSYAMIKRLVDTLEPYISWHCYSIEPFATIAIPLQIVQCVPQRLPTFFVEYPRIAFVDVVAVDLHEILNANVLSELFLG